MKVELTPSAEDDLLDGFHFYVRQQQRLGEYIWVACCRVQPKPKPQ
ncbi:MAG: hypothetical protein IPN53_19840 [Comamonadaceae bacterium]|nr:hypothetical protein [Comamonadaceae bacterium]